MSDENNSVTTSDKKTMKKKRLGVRPQSGTAIEGLGKALGEMSATDAFLEKNKTDTLFLKPSDIKKNFNARFVPCSLEEFSNIDWPDLSLSSDDASEIYPELIKDKDWFKELSSRAQLEFIDFLIQIHIKAQSIASSSQIQPITAEKLTPDDKEVFIVDGERRTLAVLYSKGKIPYVKAQIYNRPLSAADRARIKDEANLFQPLKASEVIDSKMSRLEHQSELMELPLRALGTELKVNRNYAQIIKSIFVHPERKFIMSRISNESLVWNDVKYLLEKGAKAVIPEITQSSPVVTKNKAENKSEDKGNDTSELGNQLSNYSKRIESTIGYKCKLTHNPRKDEVKLTISCPQEKLEELINTLGIDQVEGTTS
jgi:hypothetical protein